MINSKLLNKNGPISEFNPKLGSCWIWLGKTNPNGYGPYRRLYESINGPIKPGLELDHLCRVRRCMNPVHLEPVTRKENQKRGFSPYAIKSKQTYCVNGHEFSPENTYFRKDRPGTRECIKCSRLRNMLRGRENRRKQGIPIKGQATHCHRGHKFTAENTRYASNKKGSYRICRICLRIANRKADAKKRLKRHGPDPIQS